MNASKENADNALKSVDFLGRSLRAGVAKGHLNYLREFVEAAKRKLPSEAAYANARTGDELFEHVTGNARVAKWKIAWPSERR